MGTDRKLKVGFVTTVSGRWPRELPGERDKEYAAWLRQASASIELVKPGGIAVDQADVDAAIDLFRAEDVDLVILLIGAFTGDAIAVSVAERVGAPVLVWALREPPFDGGRLLSNALVAATMNAAALRRVGAKYHFVYGDVTEERVAAQVTDLLRAYAAVARLRRTFLGMLGYRPTGFYSFTFDETLIRKTFGVTLEEFDLAHVLQKAKELEQEPVEEQIRQVKETVDVIDLTDEYLENHARLYLAIHGLVREQGFDGVSLKCWPELGQVNCTPCAVISRLADDGMVVGCEADVDATLTMLLQRYLVDAPIFMCDLISVDEDANTVLLWHCGQAGRALLAGDGKPRMMNHSLAGEGTVIEGTLKAGTVTIARLSNIDGRYKLWLQKGEALATDKVVRGVMANVRLEEPALDVVYGIADAGVPHHYSAVWADVYEDMIAVARLLDVEVIGTR